MNKKIWFSDEPFFYSNIFAIDLIFFLNIIESIISHSEYITDIKPITLVSVSDATSGLNIKHKPTIIVNNDNR